MVKQLDFLNTERKAKTFLKRLAPEDTQFTFQTFDDGVKNDKKLVHVLHGTLDKHLQKLIQLNKKGAGVYVTVNTTDLKGRKKENMIGVRTLWCEQDHGEVPDFPIAPHMRIKSSRGKYHHYFLVSGGVSSRIVDEFAAVQQRLVDDWQSDPNAKDISRVLRLPGFYHMKVPADPQLVAIVQDSGAKALKWEKLKSFFPPVDTIELDPLDKLDAPAAKDGILLKPALILSAFEYIDADSEYHKWLTVGMALHKIAGGSEEGFTIWDDWSMKGISYKAGECETKWDSFGKREKGIEVGEGTIFNYAYENGWNGQYKEIPAVLNMVQAEWYRQLRRMSDHYGMVSVEGQTRVVYRQKDESINQWTNHLWSPCGVDLSLDTASSADYQTSSVTRIQRFS